MTMRASTRRSRKASASAPRSTSCTTRRPVVPWKGSRHCCASARDDRTPPPDPHTSCKARTRWARSRRESRGGGTAGCRDGGHLHGTASDARDDRPGCDSGGRGRDRKSTRLNSSHSQISYAVFCLKKKKKKNDQNCRIHVDHEKCVDARDTQ